MCHASVHKTSVNRLKIKNATALYHRNENGMQTMQTVTVLSLFSAFSYVIDVIPLALLVIAFIRLYHR